MRGGAVKPDLFQAIGQGVPVVAFQYAPASFLGASQRRTRVPQALQDRARQLGDCLAHRQMTAVVKRQAFGADAR